jgi:hypothetical protein
MRPGPNAAPQPLVFSIAPFGLADSFSHRSMRAPAEAKLADMGLVNDLDSTTLLTRSRVGRHWLTAWPNPDAAYE